MIPAIGDALCAVEMLLSDSDWLAETRARSESFTESRREFNNILGALKDVQANNPFHNDGKISGLNEPREDFSDCADIEVDCDAEGRAYVMMNLDTKYGDMGTLAVFDEKGPAQYLIRIGWARAATEADVLKYNIEAGKSEPIPASQMMNESNGPLRTAVSFRDRIMKKG